MGHQRELRQLRMSPTRVLSVDSAGYWILWDYAAGSVVAKGNSGCQSGTARALLPGIDMAGTTAAVLTPTGFELRATADGIYDAKKNQMLSVGGGVVAWTSGDPQTATWAGAVAGSRVVLSPARISRRSRTEAADCDCTQVLEDG